MKDFGNSLASSKNHWKSKAKNHYTVN